MSGGGGLTFGLALVALSAVWPFFTLMHEFAHAAVALTATDGLVVIRVGKSPAWIRGRTGRLAFELSPLPERKNAPGTAMTYARMSAPAQIAYSVAGSAAHAFAAL